MRVSSAPPEDESPEVSETEDDEDGDDEDGDDEDGDEEEDPVVTRVGPLDDLGAADGLAPAGAGGAWGVAVMGGGGGGGS
jgi:hypothetical protein